MQSLSLREAHVSDVTQYSALRAELANCHCQHVKIDNRRYEKVLHDRAVNFVLTVHLLVQILKTEISNAVLK